jgi:uncharacterized protein YcfJ
MTSAAARARGSRPALAFLAIMTAALPAVPVGAQTDEDERTESPAKEVGVYVFPQKEQDAAQQDKDETECFDAALSQSGVDPAKPPPRAPTARQQEAVAQEAARNAPQASGQRARGAAKGAVVGAVGGAILGAPGAGAALGAGAGTVRGGSNQRQANAQAQQQAAANAVAKQKKAYSRAKAAYDKDMDSFKRAFGACLDARGYSVK